MARKRRKGYCLVRILGLGSLIVALAFGSLLTPNAAAAENTSPVLPQLVGEQAVVIDASTGVVLYEKNATQRVAPASLTKLFTALVAIENTPPQRRMTVAKGDLVGEASAGLEAGEKLSFETLLQGLMLASGNDAAMTIARNVGASESPSELNGVTSFVDVVNQRLASLGIHDTHLVNPHGLDTEGHYSTARDIAAITMLGLQTEPDMLAAIASPGYMAEGHQFTQTNQLIGNYPGAIGGKTGITDNAGYCLMGIAHRDGHTLISVVLGSTPDAWYNDAMLLFDQGFATLATPGYAQGRPVITFPNAQPVQSTSIVHSQVDALILSASGADTASVRVAAGNGDSLWNVWRWPLGATLVMIVAVVCAVQTRALIELRKRPAARGMRPRRQPVPKVEAPTPAIGETQPFVTTGAWSRPAPRTETVFPTVWSGSTGD